MEFVKDVTTEDFGRAVLQRSHKMPVVVDFWAEWCGPCRTLDPMLERVTQENAGAFELVKVDVDRNQALARQFGVQGIPMVLGFRDGQAVSRFTGAIPEAALRQWVDDLLPSEADLVVDRARDAVLEGDHDQGEALFRQALEHDDRHQDAATGLASLLIARGQTEEALIVLGKLSPTAEVERLQAAARVTASQESDVPALEAKLEADASDQQARLELGRALAAKAEFEPALDHLLAVVASRGDSREEARRVMLDIFDLLGADHPLAVEYRRKLASELF